MDTECSGILVPTKINEIVNEPPTKELADLKISSDSQTKVKIHLKIGITGYILNNFLFHYFKSFYLTII